MPILAEEYIDGDEYSVETISINGKHEIASITEKITSGFPHFIETGHQTPARLDDITRNKINYFINEFLNVIEQQTGPTHTEIKIGRKGIKIIESQTRIGGDQIWEMTERVSGVDQMSETICSVLNLPLPTRNPIDKATAIRFFIHENKEIKQINHIEKARMSPGVIRVHCKNKIGDKLGQLKSSDSRQGYVLASGKTIEEAIFNAEKAIQEVQFA